MPLKKFKNIKILDLSVPAGEDYFARHLSGRALNEARLAKEVTESFTDLCYQLEPFMIIPGETLDNLLNKQTIISKHSITANSFESYDQKIEHSCLVYNNDNQIVLADWVKALFPKESHKTLLTFLVHYAEVSFAAVINNNGDFHPDLLEYLQQPAFAANSLSTAINQKGLNNIQLTLATAAGTYTVQDYSIKQAQLAANEPDEAKAQIPIYLGRIFGVLANNLNAAFLPKYVDNRLRAIQDKKQKHPSRSQEVIELANTIIKLENFRDRIQKNLSDKNSQWHNTNQELIGELNHQISVIKAAPESISIRETLSEIKKAFAQTQDKLIEHYNKAATNDEGAPNLVELFIEQRDAGFDILENQKKLVATHGETHADIMPAEKVNELREQAAGDPTTFKRLVCSEYNQVAADMQPQQGEATAGISLGVPTENPLQGELLIRIIPSKEEKPIIIAESNHGSYMTSSRYQFPDYLDPKIIWNNLYNDDLRKLIPQDQFKLILTRIMEYQRIDSKKNLEGSIQRALQKYRLPEETLNYLTQTYLEELSQLYNGPKHPNLPCNDLLKYALTLINGLKNKKPLIIKHPTSEAEVKAIILVARDRKYEIEDIQIVSRDFQHVTVSDKEVRAFKAYAKRNEENLNYRAISDTEYQANRTVRGLGG